MKQANKGPAWPEQDPGTNEASANKSGVRSPLSFRAPLGRSMMLVAIALVLGAAGYAFHETVSLSKAQATALESSGMLADAEALSAATYEAESDARAYALAPRAALLASRQQAIATAWDLANLLEKATVGDPEQRQRVEEIRRSMGARFDAITHATDAKIRNGAEAQFEGRGRFLPLEQDLRTTIVAFVTAEHQRLLANTTVAEQRSSLEKRLILFAAFPAALGLGLMSLLVLSLIRRGAKLERSLRGANVMLETVLTSVPVGVFTHSPEQQIVSWNPAAERIFELKEREVLGVSTQTLPKALSALLTKLQEDTVCRPSAPQEKELITWVRENGQEIRLHVTAAAMPGTQVLGIVQDVTAFHKLEEELLHIAHHDTLTGLPNRMVLDDRFNQMLKRTRRDGKKCAVLEIDLDRFKDVNDHHGHEVGDQFLREVAARLNSALRSTDTLVRVGGDEFVCLVESLHTELDADLVATKLMASLADPIDLEHASIAASISIGIAIYPTDGTKAAQLRKQADAALYRAKASGKGQFKRYERNDADVRRRQIQEVLESAIEKDAFYIEYQPQYTSDNHLRGFEALLRLKDPVLGLLSPGEFIPIAEHCGLIHEIGSWVLQRACTTFAEFRRRGYDPGILAVNVSAPQFVRGNFSDTVAEVLSRTGLLPEYLELELTESMVMSDIEESSRQMHRLKQAGMSLAIDDFGTGYSSLNHLHRLPIDFIKIDRSFVSEIDKTTATTRPIVEAIVGLGKSLAIKTIAEGVETPRQHEYLREIGCDYLQGFLFSKPLPVAEVEARLSRAVSARPGTKPAACDFVVSFAS